MSSPDVVAAHCRLVVREVLRGRVVPLLGAGVNLCDRPADSPWREPGCSFLPSGGELAAYLAEAFAYPDKHTAHDLSRVSQWAALMAGRDPLYEDLHDVFDATYQPTAVHRFLASLPRKMREQDRPVQHQVVVTTNYDDALETAFRDEQEPFDVVTYLAEGEHRGSFTHCPPDDEARLIEIPNQYDGLPFDERGNPTRTVILKIHGAIDRDSPEQDSYVITEDHYIEYMTRADIPVGLGAKLKSSHVLFLGYSMRDWNLRVLLHRIWGDAEQGPGRTSWSIQVNPEPMEQRFWNKRGVEIFDIPLDDYVEQLDTALADAIGAGART